jgi:hypothetical protein
MLDERKAVAEKLRGEWQKAKLEVQAKQAKLKALVGEKGSRLKRGNETEAQIKQLFGTIVCRELLERCLSATVAEALARDESLEARLREGYERVHGLMAGFLAKREPLLAHLRDRRDAALRQREMYLYVFNQVFRERVLDGEIQKKLKELQGTLASDALRAAVGSFFFKRWLHEPALPMEEVERALAETVRQHARRTIEEAAAGMNVRYADVVRILREVAETHVSSIFDAKYKEHPQAAARGAMFLCYREEALPTAAGRSGEEPLQLTDVAQVPDLPFQVLQVTEIHNLPFRALRQYASLDCHRGLGRKPNGCGSRRGRSPSHRRSSSRREPSPSRRRPGPRRAQRPRYAPRRPARSRCARRRPRPASRPRSRCPGSRPSRRRARRATRRSPRTRTSSSSSRRRDTARKPPGRSCCGRPHRHTLPTRPSETPQRAGAPLPDARRALPAFYPPWTCPQSGGIQAGRRAAH